MLLLSFGGNITYSKCVSYLHPITRFFHHSLTVSIFFCCYCFSCFLWECIICADGIAMIKPTLFLKVHSIHILSFAFPVSTCIFENLKVGSESILIESFRNGIVYEIYLLWTMNQIKVTIESKEAIVLTNNCEKDWTKIVVEYTAMHQLKCYSIC